MTAAQSEAFWVNSVFQGVLKKSSIGVQWAFFYMLKSVSKVASWWPAFQRWLTETLNNIPYENRSCVCETCFPSTKKGRVALHHSAWCWNELWTDDDESSGGQNFLKLFPIKETVLDIYTRIHLPSNNEVSWFIWLKSDVCFKMPFYCEQGFCRVCMGVWNVRQFHYAD